MQILGSVMLPAHTCQWKGLIKFLMVNSLHKNVILGFNWHSEVEAVMDFKLSG